ncbi:MAG: hypothetical protein JNJ88_00235 [Planctomycetes bacterium]|nr:hypothetical protein [Planctomycetota bacterium]
MQPIQHILTSTVLLVLTFVSGVASAQVKGGAEERSPIVQVQEDPAVVQATKQLKSVFDEADAAVQKQRAAFEEVSKSIEAAGGVQRLDRKAFREAKERLMKVARDAEKTAGSVMRQEPVVRGAIRTLVDRNASVRERWNSKIEVVDSKIEEVKTHADLDESARTEFVKGYEAARAAMQKQVEALRGMDSKRGDFEKRLNTAFTTLKFSQDLLKTSAEVLEADGDASEALAKLESLVKKLQDMSLGVAKHAREMAKVFEEPQP